jgi:hypothetical protein
MAGILPDLCLEMLPRFRRMPVLKAEAFGQRAPPALEEDRPNGEIKYSGQYARRNADKVYIWRTTKIKR